MGYLADLIMMQRAEHHATVRKALTEAEQEAQVAKAANPYSSPPPVDPQGNRVVPSQEGGAQAGSRTGAYDTSGLPQLPGQVDPASADGNPPRGWSNVDTEASATHGPGSLVVQALRNSQMPATNMPMYVRSGTAKFMADIAARRHVTAFYGSTDVTPEQYAGQVAVPPQDLSPGVYAEFLSRVVVMAQVFHSTCGRWPIFGGSLPDDVQFGIAYNSLFDDYWSKDRSTGTSVKPIPARPQS